MQIAAVNGDGQNYLATVVRVLALNNRSGF
jgi:hypothetical protein